MAMQMDLESDVDPMIPLGQVRNQRHVSSLSKKKKGFRGYLYLKISLWLVDFAKDSSSDISQKSKSSQKAKDLKYISNYKTIQMNQRNR